MNVIGNTGLTNDKWKSPYFSTLFLKIFCYCFLRKLPILLLSLLEAITFLISHHVYMFLFFIINKHFTLVRLSHHSFIIIFICCNAWRALIQYSMLVLLKIRFYSFNPIRINIFWDERWSIFSFIFSLSHDKSHNWYIIYFSIVVALAEGLFFQDNFYFSMAQLWGKYFWKWMEKKSNYAIFVIFTVFFIQYKVFNYFLVPLYF